MQAGHVLIGRPWKYGRKVIHDGFKNRYTFEKHGRKVTLMPLTPKQVHEDQIRMKGDEGVKKKSECESKNEGSEVKKSEFESSSERKGSSPEAEEKREKKKFEAKRKKEEKSDKSEKRAVSLFAKESEVKRAFFTRQPMFVLMCKGAYLNTNKFDPSLPSCALSLL